MARVTGLEPAASGVTGRRSNQLSYTRNSRRFGTRVPKQCQSKHKPQTDLSGINLSAGEIGLQGKMVGDDGIEPPTLSV